MDSKNLTTLLKRRVDELEVFVQVGKTVTSTLDIKQVLNVLMDKITELLQPRNWSMLLIDDDTQELYFEIVVGEGAEKIKNIRMKIGEGICGWVAREAKPLLISDVNKDPRFSKKVDDVTKFKTEAIVAVPMVSKGKVLGVIELINKKEGGGEFNNDDLKLLQTLADYAAIALENAHNYKRIHELTIRDDVTRLFNSRHMHHLIATEVERAQKTKTPFSLVFLDLDYFKTVNDTHGHQLGSLLLGELGDLIKESLGPTGIGTRYGGDEFVLLLPNTPQKVALGYVEKLRESIKAQTFLTAKGLKVKLTASFGVATYPDNANNKDDLVRAADQAMYRVKETSRDNIAVAR